MTANTHMDASIRSSRYDDKLQLPIAALYSGAFHRTAEAHAIVADHVFREVEKILPRQD